jgi:hypothetical protein
MVRKPALNLRDQVLAGKLRAGLRRQLRYTVFGSGGRIRNPNWVAGHRRHRESKPGRQMGPSKISLSPVDLASDFEVIGIL